MALMQKPTGATPEDNTEPDMVVLLEESGNIEQENVEYSGVAAFIAYQFRHVKDDSMNNRNCPGCFARTPVFSRSAVERSTDLRVSSGFR